MKRMGIPLVLCGLMLGGCVMEKPFDARVFENLQDRQVELGDPVFLSPSALIEDPRLDMRDFKDMAMVSTLLLPESGFVVDSGSSLVSLPELGYLPVGDYSVSFFKGEYDGTMTIQVRDTVAPEFLHPKQVFYVEKGKPFSLLQQFKLKDKADCSLIAYGSLDTSKPGIYSCRVTAEDASGNQSELDVKIHVIDPKKPKATLQEQPDTGTLVESLEKVTNLTRD